MPALFLARPRKHVSLHPMPPTSWLAPSVPLESVSASPISFVLIFAIALRVRREFSTAVSSLPYNVRGGTPQFVETSHTAGKVFLTVATDEDQYTRFFRPSLCISFLGHAVSDYGNDEARLFMSGFFQELQRRKVYRVASAYIIAAGFIIQIGSAGFPAWELPNWTLRLVVVLLLIGFPIALILSWAYDVTAEGIRATPAVSAPGTHRRRNLILLVATGVIVSAAAGFFLLPRASARKIDKSIAVLPFQNLSDEKENAYFADGIQDDILTNLSKIGDLKVISRMSVMSYRGEGTHNAREIGKALGVAALLEGSVRRVGNRVRVNVQLIDASNDEHVWAEDYDRDLTDVFAIQTDLAQKIASALQAKLSSNEKARLDHRPTQNSDAYLLFVQAHGYASQRDIFRDTSLKAEPLFEQAVKLDPNFAAAFAGLSMVESWIYHSFDPTEGRRQKARLNADEALRLQPDLPEGHLALGFSYYYGDRHYERALAEFEIARQG